MTSKNITSFGDGPSTFDEAMKLSEVLAGSDLVPKDYKGKPANVFVCIQFGNEIGLKPMQSLQNISVISGRPCLWGDSVLALIQGHKDFEDIIETDDGTTATCTVMRRNRTPHTATFSIEDSKRAGLAGRGTWTQYPARMRQMRARAFAIRDTFADVLKGVSFREEVEDIPKEKQFKVVADANPQSRVEYIKEQVRSAPEKPDEDIKMVTVFADETKTETEEVTIDEFCSKNSTGHDVQGHADTFGPHQFKLKKMVAEFDVETELVNKWVSKAKCFDIGGLSDEQAQKCITFIEKSYDQNTKLLKK